jgi:hypothetical protein
LESHYCAVRLVYREIPGEDKMGKEDLGGPDRKRDEKDEKDRQKHQEKSVEEKWSRDPLSAMVWASVFIWAGVILLFSSLGAFETISEFIEGLPIRDWTIGGSEARYFDLGPWNVFFVGAAIILFIEAAIRLLVPTYRRSVSGTLILGFVFLGIGLGNWTCIWALGLIALGVSILIRGFTRKRE